MRRARTLLPIAACALAAGALAGCGNSGQATQQRLAVDDAYVNVLAAQNAAAIAYSEAIKKTTQSGEIRAFVDSAIKERLAEIGESGKLQTTERGTDETGATASHQTPREAAAALGVGFDQLAITASGIPLAAPSTDAGYVKAMQSNARGVAAASGAEIKRGSAAGIAFARQVEQQRSDESEALDALAQ